MHSATFAGIVLAGHKDVAVEVPFDPASRWNLPITRIQADRWGHLVEAQVNDVRLETAIVPRANSFYLVLPPDLLTAAGLDVGAAVHVTVRPRVGTTARAPGSVRATRPKRARPRRVSKE